jgi:hypothetical protein
MEKCQNNKRMTNFNFKVSSYSVYNLLSPSSSEPVNTSPKAAAFWLTAFVKVRLVAEESEPGQFAQRPSRDVLCRGLEKSLSEQRGRGIGTALRVSIKRGRTV